MIDHGYATPCNRDSTDVGRTPLLRAAAFGHHEVLGLLLVLPSVHPEEEDRSGLNALAWAKLAQQEKTQQILLEWKEQNPEEDETQDSGESKGCPLPATGE